MINNISNNKNEFTVFGGKNCPNCINAIKALDMLNCIYKYYDIGTKEDGAFTIFFDNFHNNDLIPKEHKTIPCIFFEGKFIGGYTQLCSFLTKFEEELNELNENF